MIKKIIVGIFLSFLPFLSIAQNAGDIMFHKPGYSIEKVLETNKLYEPQGLCFDGDGNLLVTGLSSWIYQVKPDGSVSRLTYSCGAALRDIKINPVNNDVIVGGDSGVYKYDKDTGNHVQISSDQCFYLAINQHGNVFFSSGYIEGNNSYILKYNLNSGNYAHAWTKTCADFTPWGLVLDSSNNLYICDQTNSRVIKLSPPDYDLPYEEIIVVQGGAAGVLDIDRDEADNLYVLAGDPENPPDNYFTYKTLVMKILPGSSQPEIVKDNLFGGDNLAIRNGEIFLNSPYNVIKKIDRDGNVTDYSQNYEVNDLYVITSNLEGNPIVAPLRSGKIWRINSANQVETLATNMGYISSIETNNAGELYSYSQQKKTGLGTKGYLYKIPFDGSSPEFVANLGPLNTTMKFLYQDNDHLTFTDRKPPKKVFLLNLISQETTELANNITTQGPGFDLDDDNSLYVGEANMAIKKALYPTLPPIDMSIVPPFITMDIEDSYRIRNFEVAPNNDVYIPVASGGLEGKIYIGPSSGGSAELLASGFNWPNATHFDRYGRLWVIDFGNGLFKIIHQESIISQNIKNCDDLIGEIQESSNQGSIMISILCDSKAIKMSLIAKLNNAKKSLKKGNVSPAIGQLSAFRKEVKAQKGKMIPEDKADRWIAIASGMIRTLHEI